MKIKKGFGERLFNVYLLSIVPMVYIFLIGLPLYFSGIGAIGNMIYLYMYFVYATPLFILGIYMLGEYLIYGDLE